MQDIAKHAGEGIFVSPWKFRFQNKVCLVCLVFHCKTDDGSRMTPKRFYWKIIIIINMKLLSFIFTIKLLAQINIYKIQLVFWVKDSMPGEK